MNSNLFIRVVAGDPALTPAQVIERAQADDLGLLVDIPFTDPIAVPPTIEAAHDRAVSEATPLKAALIELSQYVKALGAERVLVTVMANLVEVNQMERLFSAIAATGARDLSLVDVPMSMREAEPQWDAIAKAHQLHLMVHLAPTQSPQRQSDFIAKAKAENAVLLVGFTPTAEPFLQTAFNGVRAYAELPAFVSPFKEVAGQLITQGVRGIILEAEPIELLQRADALSGCIKEVRAALHA